MTFAFPTKPAMLAKGVHGHDCVLLRTTRTMYVPTHYYVLLQAVLAREVLAGACGSPRHCSKRTSIVVAGVEGIVGPVGT